MASQKISICFHYFLICILFIKVHTHLSFATDTISLTQPLYGDMTIVSEKGNFVLGFFGAEGRYHISIWYRYMGLALWVANRETSVLFYGISVLKISNDGNLVLINEYNIQIWSTNVSSIASNSTVAVILDSGNLVLRDSSNASKIFWQSCDNPTDTWFAGCYLGENKVTGENRQLTSWRNGDNPAPGLFSLHIESSMFVIKWNNSKQYWSSGNFTGVTFRSTPDLGKYVKFEYISGAAVNYFTYSLKDNQTMLVLNLDPSSGQIKPMLLDKDYHTGPELRVYPDSPCSVYGTCGPFGVCMPGDEIYCSCPEGFTSDTSFYDDQSKGCLRSVELQCGADDLFLELNNIRAFDHPVIINTAKNCKFACLNNCSCTAYSYDNGCSLWFGDLLSLQSSLDYNNSYTLYLRIGSSNPMNYNRRRRIPWKVLGATSSIMVCLVIIFVVFCRCRKQDLSHKIKIAEGTLVAFRYRELKAMTGDFSEKIGGGGFGSVFKGILPDSTNVAVKKLERFGQGEKQFRSEVSTIGLIHHVNVVHLHGFCSEGDNKLLVYEYMPNGSLDSHLFRNGSVVLDWNTRYQIAVGTARGLSYLHEKCRDCIVHCDIKPENVLLDPSLMPKVADFGLAKPIARDFSSALTTMRGTIGYLAPEWISGGSITAKTDVYSYGMMLLEIISGRRNTEVLHGVHYFPVLAAKEVVEGDVVSLLDPRLEGNANIEELNRACKVACWCIQDDEGCRLSMGQVVQILEGSVEISIPPVPWLLQVLAENINSNIYFSEGKLAITDEETV